MPQNGPSDRTDRADNTADAVDSAQTYNPWTIVNVVFDHLVENGFHPTLGASGHPGEPAAALLRALGITPTVEGDNRITERVRDQLADLRTSMFDEP